MSNCRWQESVFHKVKVNSPRRAAAGNGGRLGRGRVGTRRVNNVDGELLTSSDVDGPRRRAVSDLGERLEDRRRVTGSGDEGVEGSLATSPRDLEGNTLDHRSGRVDREGALGHGDTSGGEARSGNDNGRELHLFKRVDLVSKKRRK